MADEGMTDLREYIATESEAAFSRVVERYVGLVYSAALRQMRDPHLAQEVTHAVFIILARKAKSLGPDTILASWLYRTTRYAAADTLKIQRRRARREQEAYMRSKLLEPSDDVWSSVAPLLDDAMAELADADRAALILRFFEMKQARQVAEELDLSEQAAQKRITRALEKLRSIFARRGVTLAAGAIATAISAEAVQAAPIGLTATSSAAAMAAISTSASVASSLLTMTAIQKSACVAVVIAIAGGSIYQSTRASHHERQLHELRHAHASAPAPPVAVTNDLTLDKRLAALSEENAQLKQQTAELLRLRGEVGRLRKDLTAANNAKLSDSALSTARAWLNRAAQLKQYVADHPETAPPEFQFLRDREWLIIAADARVAGEAFQTDEEYKHALDSLRSQAQAQFGYRVQDALRKYTAATSNTFPANLEDLKPYVDSTVFQIVTDLYEIKSSKIFPDALRKEYGINDNQVITRKSSINDNSRSQLALHSNGSAYWQADWPSAKANQ